MKVHVFEPIHAKPLATLQQNAEVIDWENPTVQNIASADAIIVRAARVDRQMMEKAPHLQVIGKHGVGLDSIDIEAAREFGIKVVFTLAQNRTGLKLIVDFAGLEKS